MGVRKRKGGKAIIKSKWDTTLRKNPLDKSHYNRYNPKDRIEEIENSINKKGKNG
jgi:hypothetical protein